MWPRTGGAEGGLMGAERAEGLVWSHANKEEQQISDNAYGL
jgi:hypothetical protein